MNQPLPATTAAQRRTAAIRAESLRRAAPLSAEDQQAQSMPDASPAKWHLAHTTWFFETFLLRPHAAGYAPYSDAFGQLFNSYYDSLGARTPRHQRGLITRPSLAEVQDWRAHVDAALLRLIAATPDWPSLAPLLELGLHHEQQHQELVLMDVKHLLSLNPTDPVYTPAVDEGSAIAPPLAWLRYEGGLHEIGHAGPGFAFDNEMPRHRVWLEPFRLASRLVTCGEYRAFIAAGGYRTPRLWLSEGWAAMQAQDWQAPLYWRAEAAGSTQFTLHGRRAVDDAEPVIHLSYYEADAYARWSGHRLPTEAEWEHAASPPLPTASTAHPVAAASGIGLQQMFGAAWQFTASPYTPYPGFTADAGAVGEYNGKFMVNQMVLRGSACITPQGHARATYRNFFPPDARWMFAGLRLAD